MGNAPSASEATYNQRENTYSSYTSTSSADGSSGTGGIHSVQAPPPPPKQQRHRQQRQQQPQSGQGKLSTKPPPPSKMRSFPGSVLLESTLCGAIDHTEDHSRDAGRNQERLWKRVDQFGLCTGGDPSFDQRDSQQHAAGDTSMSSGSLPRRQHSLSEYSDDSLKDDNNNDNTPTNATSALFARALVSEVTDNPKTMTPAAMAEREKRLLRAQEAAKKKGQGKDGPRPVGAPGGIGQPNLLGSIAHAIRGGTSDVLPAPTTPSATVLPPNSLQENRAQQQQSQYAPNSNQKAGATGHADSIIAAAGKYSVTIGLSLSRRHSTVGHPDTVTRQTAFDFNELQDRQYKYVSSTDSSGWRAGGGERGGDQSHMASATEDVDALMDDFGSASLHPHGVPRKHPSPTVATANSVSSQSQQQQFHKVAAPDTVHIPIIQIDAVSPQAVDAIISALARGEIFIPHMAVLPESLSVNGISPPDLVVRFGCERNDDVPPDEWPNWCLEFMHNQLYEYFHNMGARWMKRPFSITLARKVRWKTVKHMNRYFAHAERVIDAWREKGPQYLDPQLSYIEGGATPEEVARPHGIYLLRNGVPTNYFAPNFDPPYTTKMTRSLLLNVLGKSWDKKRREWTIEPIPRLVTPSMLMAHMCGCADPGTGGFMANEVTHVGTSLGANNITDQRLVTLDQPQQQHQQHQYPQYESTSIMSSAMTGPIPMTSPSARSTTPRSSHSPVEEYSQGSQSRSSSRRRTQRQNQHVAPHMHIPTVPSDTSSTNGIPVPAANHLKSPVHRGSPTSSQQEEKKIDDEGRRQGPAQEAPGKYLTFRADGQSIQDPPSVRGSTRKHQPQPGRGMAPKQSRRPDSDVGRSVANSGTTVMHDNLLATSAHRIAARAATEPKQTIQNNKKQLALSSSTSSWKKKKGRDGGVNSRHQEANGILPNNDSGVSLDYSLDSQNMPPGEEYPQHPDGGQFAQVSQSSKRANASSANASQRSTRKQPEQREQRQQRQPQVMTVTEEDDGLSLQESGSSEVIPTDEELFIVGWAKALDANSGNYYYFTLDRTKTVWENPLSADTFVSGESSYFSGSGTSSLQHQQTYQRQAPR